MSGSEAPELSSAGAGSPFWESRRWGRADPSSPSKDLELRGHDVWGEQRTLGALFATILPEAVASESSWRRPTPLKMCTYKDTEVCQFFPDFKTFEKTLS